MTPTSMEEGEKARNTASTTSFYPRHISPLAVRVDLGDGSSLRRCDGTAPMPRGLVRAGWGPQLHLAKARLATTGCNTMCYRNPN
jgi:hypothetical protein